MDIQLLSKMITELVQNHNEVGLPGLGAFVSEFVPASFSNRGFAINPPYKKLTFIPGKTEDESLVRLYAQSNGISIQESRAILAHFLDDTRKVLIDKKIVVFPGLGRLRATRQNNFFFITDESIDIYPDGFGLETLSLKNHEESPAEVRRVVESLADILVEPVELDLEIEPELEPSPVEHEEPAHESLLQPVAIEPAQEVPVAEPELEPAPAEIQPEPQGAPVEHEDPQSAPVENENAPDVEQASVKPEPMPVVEQEEVAPEPQADPIAPAQEELAPELVEAPTEPEPAAQSEPVEIAEQVPAQEKDEAVPEKDPVLEIEPEPEPSPVEHEEPAHESLPQPVAIAPAQEVPEAEPEPEPELEPAPVEIQPAPQPSPEKPKRKRSRAAKWLWLAPLIIIALATLAIATFLILVQVSPDFVDTLLYTPEELRIINY